MLQRMADLKISEVFASVQGEGVTVGTPSVFVRLALCNLRCTWCDTPYTWDWSRFEPSAEIHRRPVEDVATEVRGLGPSNVVITGGEPLMQQAGLEALLGALGDDYTVEVETAGTLVPSRALISRVNTWNVSPKLAHSGNPEAKRVVPEALALFAGLANASFKVVVRGPEDIDEALALCAAHGIEARRLVLMPEGTEAGVLLERSRVLAAECVARDLRLGTRLQVLLWGDERGT